MSRSTSRASWVAAGTAVLVLVVVEATRPVTPPVMPVAPSEFLDPEAIRVATSFRGPLRWASVASVLLRAGTGAGVLWWALRHPGGTPTRWRLVRIGGMAAAVWALTDVVRLPVQVWAWRRSVDVGLSTQALPGWARDWLVERGPYWIGVGLAVMGAAWVRERHPRGWVPIAGVAGGLLGALLVVVSPLVFEPLLFRFTPLDEGALRSRIDALVEQADADRAADIDAEVLVADASRRTTASNAYVSGIGTTRRIVLYDTLLADAPDDEVAAIVAHELGHDLHHDVERAAISLVAVAVLALWAVERLVGRRLTDHAGRVTTSGAIRAVAVIIVLAVLCAPVERWSSRRSEAAADAAAIQLTTDVDGYRAMLTGLAERNLSDPAPPSWYVALFHSHPPIASRIGRTEG